MAVVSRKDSQDKVYLQQQIMQEHTLRAENIAVLYCVGDSNSVAIKDYYITARNIPVDNVIGYNWATKWTVSESSISETETWEFIDSIYPQLRDHTNTITTVVLCGDWPYEVTNFHVGTGVCSFQHIVSYIGQIHDDLRGNESVHKNGSVWNVSTDIVNGTSQGLLTSYTGPHSDLYGRWSEDSPNIFASLGDSQTGGYGPNASLSQDTRIPFIPVFKKKRLWYGVFNLAGTSAQAQAVVNRSVAADGAYYDFGRVFLSGTDAEGSWNGNHSFIDDASKYGFQDSGIYWTDLERPVYSTTDNYYNRGEFYNPALYYAASAHESTTGMCGKVGMPGWVDVSGEAALGLRMVGYDSYYGENCRPEIVGDYNYRDGAICLFGQSSPAIGDVVATPGWEAGIPTLINVTDKQALKSAILADYNSTHNPDLTSITSYFQAYSNVDCTVSGRTRRIMGIIYNNAATTATVSIASNVITLKVNGSTTHTITAGKTLKQIYDEVLSFGDGWACYTWSGGHTPNRVISAIRSGATVAIGCSHEPYDYHDVEGVGIGAMLYGGGCIGDWLLTQLPISHNWFAYGDPLTRPINPKYRSAPHAVSSPFVISGTPATPSSFSISAVTPTYIGMLITSDFSHGDSRSRLHLEYKLDDIGEWIDKGSTGSDSFSYPTEAVAGQKMVYRFKEYTPYGSFDPIYVGQALTVPAIATNDDFSPVTVDNIQATQVTLNWASLPDPLTWGAWSLMAFLPTDDISGSPRAVEFISSSSAPSTSVNLTGLTTGTTYNLYQFAITRAGYTPYELIGSFTTS